MKFILKFPFILLPLTACASDIRRAVPVEVSVPMPVSCVTGAPVAPDWNIPHLAAGTSAVDKLKAALADLELGRGYVEELQAELKGCS